MSLFRVKHAETEDLQIQKECSFEQLVVRKKLKRETAITTRTAYKKGIPPHFLNINKVLL